MDVCSVKYGIWNVTRPEASAVNALASGGFNPLTAMILAARGMDDAASAKEFLDCDRQMIDPFLMTDMDLAEARVRKALQHGEKIAVFGDYDVDGITATCLLTSFLRSMGGNVISYIPGRLEEGYGLNPIAIRQLHAEGVKLIVTVDCGITAVEEAQLCKQLGIDLVITDHHECKEQLPEAVAVVDPHRPDGGYPHKNLSGVGVAFKLAAALSGDQLGVLCNYADMVCLGTVADVMPLVGENRVFVARGLELLRHTHRPGIAALMKESGCESDNVNATSIGFMLAPRINAAGRMGQIELAVDLFLTDDEDKAAYLAQSLCELNRQRQQVESDIYRQAVQMLPTGSTPEAIVLADERWHQGVVGIVASRIAEEYCCPTFLICLDGDHGKASSRSFGGFNLFQALKNHSHLLESYGGHELAAGFTIHRSQIDAFREAVCRDARQYYAESGQRTVLDIDCAVTADLLSVGSIDALSALEPCGNGCPKPVLMLEKLVVDRLALVGNSRHMRLRLKQGHHMLGAICFCATTDTFPIQPGDIVDVAFQPQVNEFRGVRSVQLNVQDIRPHCPAPCDAEDGAYRRLKKGCANREDCSKLLPDRTLLAAVWKYLVSTGSNTIKEGPVCLCRKIVRRSGMAMDLGQMLTCLDIFADVALLQLERRHKDLIITLSAPGQKADLSSSATMQSLLLGKES